MVEPPQLRCPPFGQRNRTVLLVPVLELLERLIDRFLIDTPPAQFGHESGPPEAFALVLGAHDGLRECGVVDQADPFQAIELRLDDAHVQVPRQQHLPEFPA